MKFEDYDAPKDDITWNRAAVLWEKIDKNVTIGLDLGSALLSFVGLDFVADGLGLVYFSARGDVLNAGAFTIALTIPLANGTLARQLTNIPLNKIIKIGKKGAFKEFTSLERFKTDLMIGDNIPDFKTQKLQRMIDAGNIPESNLHRVLAEKDNPSQQLKYIDELISGKYNEYFQTLQKRFEKHTEVIDWLSKDINKENTNLLKKLMEISDEKIDDFANDFDALKELLEGNYKTLDLWKAFRKEFPEIPLCTFKL